MDATYNGGITPLLHAAEYGHEESKRRLMSSLNIVISTPPLLAVVHVLLEYGANPNLACQVTITLAACGSGRCAFQLLLHSMYIRTFIKDICRRKYLIADHSLNRARPPSTWPT